VGIDTSGVFVKSILDPTFRYTTSVNTDVRKTFARIRHDQQMLAKRLAQGASPACDNVTSIVRKAAARRD
jgi:hypothetical protein